MSKSLQVLSTEKQVFSIIEPILKKQIERQDEQGKAIHLMFESIQSMYNEFTEGIGEMKLMVQEVRDSVTLTNAECAMLHSDVANKSISLARDRFNEEEDDFKKVVGFYRRMIWKHLKEKYNVPKYNCIRRIDFEEARSFVQSFKPELYL